MTPAILFIGAWKLFVDAVDQFIARMVEREEIDFRALLDRPSALRYLSPEKLLAFLEWRRTHTASSNRRLQ
jgi:hypothetical protein